MKKLFSALFLFLLFALPIVLFSCGKDCSHENMRVSTVAPTCDREGYTLHACPDCAVEYKTDVLPSVGHTLTETVVAPTCLAEGYTQYACACGFSYKSAFTAPSGHTYVSQAVPPTCVAEGYTQYTCACGYSYQSAFVKPNGHAYVSKAVAPTCDAEGYTQYDCVCGFSYKANVLSPTGHTYTEQVTAPTCTSEGYTLYQCACGYFYKGRFLPTTSHDPVTETVSATCTEQGYTAIACRACDYAFQTDYVEPTGHTFTTKRTYPTRNTVGTVVRTCALCGYGYTNYLFYTDIYEGGNLPADQNILAKGVDVSVYQHKQAGQPLNWSAIRDAGFEFAILKAGSTPRLVNGDPAGGMDPVFEMNYEDAKENGLDVGVYFYTYASTVQGIEEDALLLVSWLKGKQLEYPVYFDLEDPSLKDLGTETLTEFCDVFISTLQANGYYGALYTNNSWLVERLNRTALKSAFDIWYARYPVNRRNNDLPISPDQSEAWNVDWFDGYLPGMWQYTDYGQIEGFDESIYFDFNCAYRDYPTLMKEFGLNGYPAKEPLP